MNGTKNISPWQFAFFRIVFGTYLCIHFVHLLPWADELFGARGMLSDARLNFTAGVLPNPLEHWDSHGFVVGFVAVMALLSFFLAIGFWRRTSALLLWFGWACLFNRNNLISNPGIPYVGLLLILCTLVPPGEPLSSNRRLQDTHWQMPAAIFWGAWILLAAGYTYSGVWKLFSPSWVDGTALQHLLVNPLARPNWIRAWLLTFPEVLLRALTWIALAGELLALPLTLSRRGRFLAWTWMLAMHLGVLMVVDFADLTFGMVMIHLFTFDPDWMKPKATKNALVLFDRDCGLCERTVQFLRREDAREALLFRPLQEAASAAILARHGLAEAPLRSMVFVVHEGKRNERALTRSDAFFAALDALGGLWTIVSWLRCVPRPWRDCVYDWVAANRYRWLGRAASCPMPGTD